MIKNNPIKICLWISFILVFLGLFHETQVLAADADSVKNFGAQGDGRTDDTAAIRAAVAGSSNIYFPPGDYLISGRIDLKSNMRIYGEGATSKIIQNKVDEDIFRADGSWDTFATNITVENLSFLGSDGGSKGQALKIVSAKNITFQNNLATKINFFSSGINFRNPWDSAAKDPSASAGLVSESQLSDDIKILNNTGSCSLGDGSNGCDIAISLAFSKNSQITSNKIDHYQHGITWWGGSAGPTEGGGVFWQNPLTGASEPIDNPRWAQNITINDNEVKNTIGGIWGSMGQDINVNANAVERCDDVCLDAEGSYNVTFDNNTVKNATNSALATFHFSKNILFIRNQVTQDGSMGRTLYNHWNSTPESGEITVTLDSNEVSYTGTSGVGAISKDAMKLLTIKSNTLNNVIMDFQKHNSCSSEIVDNTITFKNSLGAQPAIKETAVYSYTGDGAVCTANIQRNNINSTVAQKRATAAVYVLSNEAHHATTTTISDNAIKGFDKSVQIIGNSDSSAIKMIFNVLNNKVSGALVDSSPLNRSINTFEGNTNLSGAPVESAPFITLAKTVDKTTAKSGEILTYTLVYDNESNLNANNVKVSDPISAATDYIATGATAGANYATAEKTVSWNIGAVSGLSNGTVIFKVKVK